MVLEVEGRKKDDCCVSGATHRSAKERKEWGMRLGG